MQDKNSTRKILMAMVGAYLIYTGGNLIVDVTKGNPENAMLFIIAGAAFVIIGALTVFVNMKEYISAVKADVMITGDSEEENMEDVSDVYDDEEVHIRKNASVVDVKVGVDELIEEDEEEEMLEEAEELSETSPIVLDLAGAEEIDNEEE